MSEKRGFLALALARRSVRRYMGKPVERAVIERCIEAARIAPSACNGQPWTFIVVVEPALRQRVAAATSGGVLPLNHFTRQAPVLIVVVAEPSVASARFGAAVKDKPFAMMDIAIAAEHICLQAASEGLGTCMLGWFDETKVRELLAIPGTSRPALILTLGHPADTPASRKRKALDAIRGWNAYPQEKPHADTPIARSPWRTTVGLLLSLILAYAAAAAGGAATAQAGTFYATLEHPAWAPPGWLFGPVWMLLYTLMGVAAWRVWRARGLAGARGALGRYGCQLAVNALWSWIFFAWRLGGAAFCWIVLLCGLVAATIRAFSRIDRWAGRLLWPYLGWITFAAVLAYRMWRLNPDLL